MRGGARSRRPPGRVWEESGTGTGRPAPERRSDAPARAQWSDLRPAPHMAVRQSGVGPHCRQYCQ
ncbi:hypothetical protein PROPJV5_1648 [Propionibacterium ruminifibrarum]|uniref:Uncharacterized protein n=1 Tax=Propionibacterium ruminifibrarum TaxID=1962131 RepID=A0A375I1G4_9ACTN|nr:hypothetical protein PROPJV5_1648 [Propionibacterium ruminifibrarum]